MVRTTGILEPAVLREYMRQLHRNCKPQNFFPVHTANSNAYYNVPAAKALPQPVTRPQPLSFPHPPFNPVLFKTIFSLEDDQHSQ